MNTWTWTAEDLTEFANQVKETLLEQLDRQGQLRVPAVKLSQEIAVVVYKPKTLGSLIKRWFGDKDDDGYKINIVKMLWIAEPEKRKVPGNLSLLHKQPSDPEK